MCRVLNLPVSFLTKSNVTARCNLRFLRLCLSNGELHLCTHSVRTWKLILNAKNIFVPNSSVCIETHRSKYKFGMNRLETKSQYKVNPVELHKQLAFRSRTEVKNGLPPISKWFSSSHSSCLSQYRHLSTTAPTCSEAIRVTSSNTSSEAIGQLFLPDFPPIQGAESLIQYFHHITGLEWWSSIILTAFFMRGLLIMPLTIYTHHNMVRLAKLGPEVKETSERLKLEVSVAMHRLNWNEKRARQEYNKNLNRLLKNMYLRDNCHPMKNTASFWLQIPLWVSVSSALRNMTARSVNPDMDHHDALASLKEEGVMWIPDLTQVDSTWILPVMMCAVSLFNIEISYLNVSEITRYRRILTYVLRAVSLLFIPLSASLPSSVVLYWVSSGTFAAIQNILLDYSPFRRLVRLPQSPLESTTPVRTLLSKARSRYLEKIS